MSLRKSVQQRSPGCPTQPPGDQTVISLIVFNNYAMIRGIRVSSYHLIDIDLGGWERRGIYCVCVCDQNPRVTPGLLKVNDSTEMPV